MSQENSMEYSLIDRIRTLADLKRHDDALKESVKALASFPDSYYLHYFKGLAHYQLDDFIEAERASRTAIKIDVHNGDAYFLRSIVLHKQLNFSGELEMAERAASLDPEDSQYLGRLVEAQLQSGLLKQAKDTVTQLIQLDPGSIECHEQLATICMELEDWSDAEKEFRAALAIDPTLTYLHQNVAQMLLLQHKYESAIDVLFHAIKLDSTNTHIQDQLYRSIDQYLPAPWRTKARQEATIKLHPAIVQFYTDRRNRNNFSQNNSILVNSLTWVGLLTIGVIFTIVFFD